jgi:hypothetical protein
MAKLFDIFSSARVIETTPTLTLEYDRLAYVKHRARITCNPNHRGPIVIDDIRSLYAPTTHS